MMSSMKNNYKLVQYRVLKAVLEDVFLLELLTLSITIRKEPSFFLTNRTGAPQGRGKLGLMKPLSCSTRYQSILNSTCRCGWGIPGKSSGKKFRKFSEQTGTSSVAAPLTSSSSFVGGDDNLLRIRDFLLLNTLETLVHELMLSRSPVVCLLLLPYLDRLNFVLQKD
ncbi:hypothetical protein Tco_1204819 [Tanacetum coccineum]